MNKFSLTLIACFAISPLAFGQDSGNAAAGKKLAESWQCTLCHGPDGNGNKGIAKLEIADVRWIPRISGQPTAYFIRSMLAYKNGKRPGDNMRTLAEQLSEQNIRDLAAWYGSQTPRAQATYYDDPSN